MKPDRAQAEGNTRPVGRKSKSPINTLARRNIEVIQDRKALQHWITDVWDESWPPGGKTESGQRTSH